MSMKRVARGMALKPVISLKNISIRRGGCAVLKNIDWTTRAGEHWFIMGPNGSGKTTLIEILVGYLWPQTGSVSVLGETFGRTNLLELRAKVGYVSPWIFKRMSPDTLVEDVVASGINGSVGSFGRKSSRVKEAIRRQLRFFGCLDLSGKSFGEISSGQQLKCMLARALVHKPGLLILDEPFSLLDIGTRINMYEHLIRLCKRKGSPQLVVVTHHREDLLPILTHGLILKDGRICVQGPREKVLSPGTLSFAFDVDKSAFKRYFY